MTQVAEARRFATTLAQSIGFNETLTGEIALITTECATNLIKHTSAGGELLVRSLTRDTLHGDALPGIELIALDKGAGIANMGDALRDGYSTAGTAGTGLGAIKRLADVFDIYSVRQGGTAVLTQLWAKPPIETLAAQKMEVGSVCVPKPGEQACGDAWAIHQEIDRCLLMVADGLGHGPGAADASRTAVDVFAAHSHLRPDALIKVIHENMKHTRGAVIAIAEIRYAEQQVHFVGVGNVESRLYTPDTPDLIQHMVSHNGTAGFALNRVQAFSYAYSDDALIIMNSDGCTSHLSMSGYPGLPLKHPALIAGVLYRDFNRGYDDTTVLVACRR